MLDCCCAPKLKLLGVVVNVFGGVKVVLGPVKGDAERALPPPRLILAILERLLVRCKDELPSDLVVC